MRNLSKNLNEINKKTTTEQRFPEVSNILRGAESVLFFNRLSSILGQRSNLGYTSVK